METIATVTQSPTAAQMFHSDIQEYHAPKGDIAPEVWNEFDMFIRAQMFGWECANSNVTIDRWRYNLEHMRETIGCEYLRPSSKAENYYVGTIAKRVAKYFRKICNLTVPPADLSKVGDIAARYASRESVYLIDFDQDLDWGAQDFGQTEGSCFWSCRTGARGMLRQHGAYAVRLWEEDGFRNRGIGRAWIAPHDGLWFLFNAYGPLAQLPLARLICNRWGLTYLRVPQFRNKNSTEGVLYINDGATAFGPADRIAALGDPPGRIDLGWREISEFSCSSCDCSLDEDDCEHSPDGETLCRDCWSEHYCCCHRCGETQCNDDVVVYDGAMYCNHCANRQGIVCCEGCSEYCTDATDTRDGAMCESCLDNYTCCESCGDYRQSDEMTEFNRAWYCDVRLHRCIDDVARRCIECEDLTERDDLTDCGRCADCVPEEEPEVSPVTAEGEDA